LEKLKQNEKLALFQGAANAGFPKNSFWRVAQMIKVYERELRKSIAGTSFFKVLKDVSIPTRKISPSLNPKIF
jgi:hypothetical protein